MIGQYNVIWLGGNVCIYLSTVRLWTSSKISFLAIFFIFFHWVKLFECWIPLSKSWPLTCNYIWQYINHLWGRYQTFVNWHIVTNYWYLYKVAEFPTILYQRWFSLFSKCFFSWTSTYIYNKNYHVLMDKLYFITSQF